VSVLLRNSVARCSSPTSLEISPKMPNGIGFTCLAKCYRRTASMLPHRARCWHSQRFPMSAATWPCSPKNILRGGGEGHRDVPAQGNAAGCGDAPQFIALSCTNYSRAAGGEPVRIRAWQKLVLVFSHGLVGC